MNRNIYTYGSDERLKYCRAYIEAMTFFEKSIHILQIPTTRDGKMLNGTCISLSELAGNMGRGELVLAYGAPPDFAEALAERGALLVDAALDGEYQEVGAELTAQGAVVKILSQSQKAPRDMRFGIIGYGRIGRRLASLLTFLGAGVTVFTSRPQLWEDLGRLGIKAVGNYELPMIRAGGSSLQNPFSELDVLINTAPSQVLTVDDAKSLINTRVIELASGENIPNSIEFEVMPSLPAKMFPESAGIAYARAFLRNIGE